MKCSTCKGNVNDDLLIHVPDVTEAECNRRGYLREHSRAEGLEKLLDEALKDLESLAPVRSAYVILRGRAFLAGRDD